MRCSYEHGKIRHQIDELSEELVAAKKHHEAKTKALQDMERALEVNSEQSERDMETYKAQIAKC